MLMPSSAGRQRLRAAVLCTTALVAAAAAWELRPAAPRPDAPPDTDVVLICAWTLWLAAGYLCLATAASVIAHVLGAHPALATPLRRLAPAGLSRLLEGVVAVGVAAVVLGQASGSAAATTPAHRAAPLDWPSLRSPAAQQPAKVVVVRPGDSLWSITTDQLGPAATPARVAAAWPRWWGANRRVIGADPNLILPGQRLHPPVGKGSSR